MAWCREFYAEFYAWGAIAWRLWGLRREETWRAACQAVNTVQAQLDLRNAAQLEENARFCPMCGQIPDGDRRMDHARSTALEILRNKKVRRSELDAAISLYYFVTK